MPFAVFRRHQRKLLACFAILAMISFVLSDSLTKLLSGGYAGGGDPAVVDLYGRAVHRSDINAMAAARNRANLFMTELFGFSGRPFFGDISTRSMVDALILEHEADQLKMPDGPEVAREWLTQVTGGMMSRALFDGTMRRFGDQFSGEQILRDIAGQVRLQWVRDLQGKPQITPLDVFRTYRDQNERVSVKAVAFPVASFLPKVSEPTDEQIRAYYEKYKDILPDPARATPGFKIPRQVKVEILSLDGTALVDKIRDKLTESELRSYYENRKSEFVVPTGFPDDIFAGDPKAELTPPQLQPFDEVRSYLATSMAEERAQAEIINVFGRIKDEEMIKFADEYYNALDELNEARKSSAATADTSALPKPRSLKSVATREGLNYELSPLLGREQAENYGQISTAEVGLSRLSGGRKFADELFDTKTSLFEPVELTDPRGRRYLVRKLEDQPPRVPTMTEIRPEVVLSWKTEQARPLARKSADSLAAQIRKDGGTIKGDKVDGHPVITTDPITKLQPAFPMPGQFFSSGSPTPSPISLMPFAGEVLRDAYFGLEPGQVTVAPDQPESTYYVMTLDRRLPATFATLYAPNGDSIRYRSEAQTQAAQDRERNWMTELRKQAGLDPSWIPSDETKGGEPASRS